MGKKLKSWQLFKVSIAATFRHPKLLWFPVLITAFTLFIALFFISAMALPAVLHPTGYHLTQKEHWAALEDYYFPKQAPQEPGQSHSGLAESKSSLMVGNNGVGYGVVRVYGYGTFLNYLCGLTIYLVSMFLATFFNVAFYSEIMAAMDGRGVSLRRGLRTARGRLPSILAWALLAGAVGWLIRVVEERLPFVGKIVMGLIGVTWSVAAVFAIPVIVQRESLRNPIEILKQSAMTLKRTWGESLIGYLGFSVGSVVVFLGSLVPLALGIVMAVVLHSVVIGLISVLLWLMGLLLIGYVSSVASHIFRCALYKYATEGVIPEPYNKEFMDLAWKVKKS